MSETQKTGIFVAVAAVAVILAYATRPVSVTKQDEKGGLAAGDLLFKEDASDITKASSLKITKFDENKLSMESFEVVRDKANGLWKIPSEYDYPADAEEQLKNATTPLSDLKILSIIEDAGRDDHTLYGVVEPNDKLEAGVTGVGMMVSVADAVGKSMASLIIGKQVDKAQEKLHYVRIPNQDPVYTVEIDPAVFDTNFRKWIKPDLLQVRSFDIATVGIRDYEIERQQQGNRLGAIMTPSMEADMSYDSASSKWKLDRLLAFSDGQSKEVALTDAEELKSDKLNSLRTAAQSLQIVGVRPKPKGLAADLKADKTLLQSDEGMISLFEQGFIAHSQGDTTEIKAVAGETLLTTQDGVRYVLRFGEERVASAAIEATEGADKKDSAESKRERYLLVTASLDESKFPLPDIQPIPETIEDLKKLDAEKAAAEAAKKASEAGPAVPAENKPAEDKPAETKPADTTDAPKAEQPKDQQPKVEEPKSAEPKADESPKSEEPKADEKKAETKDEPKADEPKTEEPKNEEPKTEENSCGPAADPQDAAADKPADDKKVDPQANQDKPTADKPADAKAGDAPAAGAKPADGKPADAKPAKQESDEELKDRLSVVQSDIAKANQRLIDARNEKLAAARKKVQELNARFADWYYLIDEASFKQLMLKRDVLIGPKTADAPGGNAPAGFPGGLPGGFPQPTLPNGAR